MIVTPKVGEITALNSLISAIDTRFHLYVNDTPLTLDTVLADFVEASFAGYAPIRVTTWIDAAWIVDRVATLADLAVWECSADGPPQTVYGYYVVNGTGTSLLWAERRVGGPVVMQFAGDTYSAEPYYSVQNEVS